MRRQALADEAKTDGTVRPETTTPRTLTRTFFRDSAIYGATGAISRGLPVLLLPFYTRVFSVTQFGIVDFLTVVALLVNLTVPLEISQAVGRFYADEGDDGERTDFASTALFFTLAGFAAFTVLSVALASPIARLLVASSSQAGVVRCAVLWTSINGVFYLAQNQLRWRLAPVRYALASAAYSVVSIVLTILLIERFSLGTAGVFLGQAAGAATGAVLSLYLGRESYRATFDRHKLRTMLSYSLPLVPSSIAVFVAYYIDRFAIRRFMTLTDVGLYGAGYRLASTIALVMVAAQGALTPLILKHHRSHEAPRELAQIFKYFLLATLCIYVPVALFAREILDVFATPKFAPAARVVPLLMAAIALSNFYIFAPGLFLEKRTKTFGVVNLAGAVVNAVLCFALVPTIGLLGAAVATSITAFLSFATLMILSQRLYPAPHDWWNMAVVVVVVILAVTLSQVLVADRYPTGHASALAVKTILACVVLGLAVWRLAARPRAPVPHP